VLLWSRFSVPKLIKAGALLVLSVLLLGVGIWIAGGGNVLADIRRFLAWTVAAVFVVFSMNLAVVTFRLSRLLQYFDINVPYTIAFKASLQGHFASLFFISLFGQVAGRQAVLRHFGTPSVFIASLTAIERIVLFIVSGVFCLLGATWLLDRQEIAGLISRISFVQITFVVILSLIASLWFGRSKFEARLLTGIRSRRSLAQFLKVVVITIIAQALVLGAFVLGGMGLAPDIGLVSLLAAAAITSFAASLPISVNGWGVREVTAIFAFGHVGIAPSSALAISILVGLCSTAVVLAALPYLLRKENEMIGGIAPSDKKTDRLPIEKTATWGLVTASAIFIFFQIHIPLDGGVINLNLADPFAVLALATVATHSLYARELPRWRVPKFNTLLLLVGLVLLLAFLNGLQVIGVTQWALAGRLFGWLILIGYLCIGVLTASYLGKMGIWRFIESMIATAVVVVLFHAFMRWLVFSGWLDPAGMPLNFEGFSGNRNAFAFQLLVCSALLLAYTGKAKEGREVTFRSLRSSRDEFLAALHGVVLTGLVFTGSRAGILTGLMLILGAGLSRFVHRRILLKSVIYGLLFWLAFAWLLPWVSQTLAGEANARYAVQSIFSNEASNIERWETIQRGFDMWLESPWLGAGVGVFIEASTEWFKQPIVIHSTPVWLLAELGILGTGVLLSALGWLFFSINRSGFAYSGNRAAVLLLAIFLVFGLVHEIFYQRIFWMVLGICIALPFDVRPRRILSRSPALR
jgi:hypothetical protein